MKFRLAFLYLFVFRNHLLIIAHDVRPPVETSPNDFPFQATVIQRWSCSGALITENYVVTPASCFSKSIESVSVYLGFRQYPSFESNRNEENTQVFSSTDVTIHEEFVDNSFADKFNDIALVKLPKPVVLSRNVRPCKCISSQETYLLNEGYANVTGWFTDRNIDMQLETVQFLNQDLCGYMFGHSFSKSQELCSKSASSTRLNLRGDIVTLNGRLVGLLTRKYTCLNEKSICSNTGVIYNLVPYLGWISQKVNVSVANLTGQDKDIKSDLTLVKVEAIVSVIRGTKKKLEQDIAIINEKIEKFEEKLANLKLDP